MIEIYCDGICEPNPGFACWAWVAYQNGEIIKQEKGSLGDGRTNNEAEYTAVGKAIAWITQAYPQEVVVIYTDSQLVVKQVTGEWGCNSERLQRYLSRVLDLIDQLAEVELKWIPGKDNAVADQLTRFAYREATGKEAPIRHKAQGR